MAEEDEEEYFGVVKDVQAFLSRPEGLPPYISKEDICNELARVSKVQKLPAYKRAEAIETSALLLKSVSDRRRLKKNSRAKGEAQTCIKILVPAAIAQLTAKEAAVTTASLKLIQQCIDNDDPQGFVVMDTLFYLEEKGIRHSNYKVSIETMKLLPGIYAHDMEVSHSSA